MKRGTIPCTGAGLARFHKWTINFPGPVTGVVIWLTRKADFTKRS